MILCWLHVPALGLLAWTPGVPVLALAAVSLALAAALAAGRLMPGDSALAAALAGQAALVIVAFAGHPGQADSYLYGFAVIAAAAVLGSVPALVTAGLVLVTCNLALGVLAPDLVPAATLPRLLAVAGAIAVQVVASAILLRRGSAPGDVAVEAVAEPAGVLAPAIAAAPPRGAAQAGALVEMLDQGLHGRLEARALIAIDDPALAALEAKLNGLFAKFDEILGGLDARLAGVANGDLSTELGDEHGGRFASLAQRTNAMIRALRDW